MNQINENQEWERYARDVQNAWHKEYQRQTVAYQQLQIEMSKLLQLLQESQRNQSDFMTETARLFDSYSNDYHDLRKDVMSFINESRTSLSQIKGMETTASRDTQAKFEELIHKIDQVIATLAQHANPAALARESSHLFQAAKSSPSASLPTAPARESSTLQQESRGMYN